MYLTCIELNCLVRIAGINKCFVKGRKPKQIRFSFYLKVGLGRYLLANSKDFIAKEFGKVGLVLVRNDVKQPASHNGRGLVDQ